MNCEIKKIVVIDDNSEFTILDPVVIESISDLVDDRKKELIKFKPKYWIELIGDTCSLKLGIERNLIKIEGLTYLVSDDLENIISKSLKEK